MSIDDKLKYGCDNQLNLKKKDYCFANNAYCVAYTSKRMYKGKIEYLDGKRYNVVMGGCDLYKSLKKK